MARYRGRIYGSRKLAQAAERRHRYLYSGSNSHHTNHNDNDNHDEHPIIGIIIACVLIVGITVLATVLGL